MVLSTQQAVAEPAAARQTSQRALAAAQEVLMHDPENGLAMGTVAEALAILGEQDRAREMVRFGMLMDPDNTMMKMCFVRAMVLASHIEEALDVFEHVVDILPRQMMWMWATAEMAPLRAHPGYEALAARAEARFAAERAALKL